LAIEKLEKLKKIHLFEKNKSPFGKISPKKELCIWSGYFDMWGESPKFESSLVIGQTKRHVPTTN